MCAGDRDDRVVAVSEHASAVVWHSASLDRRDGAGDRSDMAICGDRVHVFSWWL